MTTCLGKSCSRVFCELYQFVSVLISLLGLRVGCWISLYEFLVIAFLFPLLRIYTKLFLLPREVTYNTEFEKNYLRKAEVSVERISVCNVTENLA